MSKPLEREYDSPLPPAIQEIQDRVVGMYSDHPWPFTRDADEEMGWRLRVLGIMPEDYRGKDVLDLGCGTGEYALWYAGQGARSVTGVDLSDGSLAVACQRQQEGKIQNARFMKMDLLECSLPDEAFDYSYSVGVLHHTGDPFRGFSQLVRATKPGGIVIVSLYSAYSRRVLRAKQGFCKLLGGDDIDRRVAWGRRLFPGTLRRLDRRYGGGNTERIAYDIFGYPHESLHTAGEVLKWFQRTGVEFKGAFAPLRLQEYVYAFSQPEYTRFRRTFDGFPVMRLVADALFHAVTRFGPRTSAKQSFPRPSALSRGVCQSLWVFFGLRFNCFTIAGIKRR